MFFISYKKVIPVKYKTLNQLSSHWDEDYGSPRTETKKKNPKDNHLLSFTYRSQEKAFRQQQGQDRIFLLLICRNCLPLIGFSLPALFKKKRQLPDFVSYWNFITNVGVSVIFFEKQRLKIVSLKRVYPCKLWYSVRINWRRLFLIRFFF